MATMFTETLEAAASTVGVLVLPSAAVHEVASMMVARRLEWGHAFVTCGRSWARFTIPAGNGLGEADITLENVCTGFEWGATGEVGFLELPTCDLSVPDVVVEFQVSETAVKPAPAVQVAAEQLAKLSAENRAYDMPSVSGRVLVKRKSKDVDRFMRVVETEFYKALTGKMMARLRSALERGLPFDEAVVNATGARSGKRYSSLVAALEAVA